ncbi:hypothetical protein [Bradyrhizobium sp. AS23.2]|uniref:hypothetical protein n=1 Tax=Bradyrhizobium sp. AS23.2 TaxID=1680155 RepID=UPI00093898F9|nr:hypothetical protein [Bradyrhizobium sp. AS23.2]OKO76021.1 hypothetical protein AC630_23515 [Bradyrhizobium sp. AS23.2]
MDASIISALAALTGTAVGGLTSVVANWLNHRLQTRAQWLSHEKNRRQNLYRDFIEQASTCYIDALQHDEADIPNLVGLYAKLGRMRVLSSEAVINSADHIARKILDIYIEPDKTFVELRDMANNGTIDLLRDFSVACRVEFEQLDAGRI